MTQAQIISLLLIAFGVALVPVALIVRAARKSEERRRVALKHFFIDGGSF